MAIGALKILLIGFGFGILFILLSGLLTGGLLFADFLLRFNVENNFMIFGVPYGFIAGLIYFIFLKFKKASDYIIKRGILFGVGFWLSFLVFYIVGYLTFSGFSF